MRNVETALELSFHWIQENPAPSDSVALLADEAFFYHLLLQKKQTWKEYHLEQWDQRLHNRLAVAKDISLHFSSASTLQERLSLCQHLDSALMLAYLMYRYEQDKPSYQEWVTQILQQLTLYKEQVFGFFFIFDKTYAYFLQKMNVPVPQEALTREAYQGFSEQRKLIVQSYYLTHVVLFDADFFEKAHLLPEQYGRVIQHIHTHAVAIMRQNFHDIIGEFVWCLALFGLYHEPLFLEMEHHLLYNQEPDGTWRHPSYEVREWRHATYVGMLALMDAGRIGGL